MFFKIDVLKNFANFAGQRLCWSLFLTKFLANFIKKKLQNMCFLVKFARFLRTLFSTEQLWWLPLHVMLPI